MNSSSASSTPGSISGSSYSASIRFQIHGAANNFADELRVGTRYADVVPEPGTASLLGAGLSGLGLCARRRQGVRNRLTRAVKNARRPADPAW